MKMESEKYKTLLVEQQSKNTQLLAEQQAKMEKLILEQQTTDTKKSVMLTERMAAQEQTHLDERRIIIQNQDVKIVYQTDKILLEQEAKCEQIQQLHSNAIHEAKTLHTQEINELKAEIRELRDLLVGKVSKTLEVNPMLWLSKSQVQDAVRRHTGEFVGKHRSELCSYVEKILNGKVRDHQLRRALMGTDFKVDPQTKCIINRS
jgi:hypothetical protein